MKKFLGVTALVLLVATIASASVLFTPLPMGKGKWGASVSGTQTSNWQDQKDAKGNGYSASVAYGVLDKLDLYVQVGQIKSDKLTSPTGVPAAPLGTLDMTTNQYGFLLKYNILNDAEGAPVSVAVGAGAATLGTSITFTLPALLGGTAFTGTSNGSYGGGGVMVSKLFIPFVPYVGVQYLMAGGDFAKYTQLDITGGTYIAFSRNWGCFVEYSAQTQTPDGGGPSVNLNQIAASISWGQ